MFSRHRGHFLSRNAVRDSKAFCRASCGGSWRRLSIACCKQSKVLVCFAYSDDSSAESLCASIRMALRAILGTIGGPTASRPLVHAGELEGWSQRFWYVPLHLFVLIVAEEAPSLHFRVSASVPLFVPARLTCLRACAARHCPPSGRPHSPSFPLPRSIFFS